MPKILNLAKGNSFRVTNKSSSKAEIVIYEAIGQSYWGDSISAKQFSDKLKEIGDSVTEITVRINSPGGDVFDGITIFNRLKQHKAKIIVHVDGMAASIASIIALAGDEIHMGEGAQFMVHLPWTYTAGNRNDLDNTVNRLIDVEEQLISIYSKKTGLDRSELKAMLEAETWMDADTSIEKGFAEFKSEETMPIAASALDKIWIKKAPKNYFSDKKALDQQKNELKKKIQDRLART